MNLRTLVAGTSEQSQISARSPAWALTIVVVAVLSPLLPFIVPVNQYLLTIFMQVATYGIAVLGMVVILGYTGQINLAQAAFFGLGAYGLALGQADLGLSFWTSLIFGVTVAAIAGFVLGLTTLRLGGHYLAMITISFQQIFDLVLSNWIQVTRGPDGIASIARPVLFGYELNDDRIYLLLCAVILYAVTFVIWRLPKTRIGRAMQAVRENELAAEVVGVNTLAVKVIAFTLGAAFAGLGGALFAAAFTYISPDNFTFKVSIEFLTMSLLGGAQSPFGAILGTILLILLPEWLRFLKEIYLAAYGLAVILIMIFMPEGIWGIAAGIWHRIVGSDRPVHHVSQGFDPDVSSGRSCPILTICGLQKHFGGVKAVDNINIQVERGTVHALIGPNGSGKTTTLNLLSGIYRPTAGTILIDGVDVTQKKPHRRAAHGLGRTFQNIRLFSALSVIENVMIGAQRPNNPMGTAEAALQRHAMSALDFVGLSDRAHVIVRNLPYGHQRLVEIARALAGHPKLLLLDEPAAGLNETEKQELIALLKRLRNHGLTILLIEHDMGLIKQVSDRISVLNFGQKIAEGSPTEALRNADVIAAYLGESVDHAAA